MKYGGWAQYSFFFLMTLPANREFIMFINFYVQKYMYKWPESVCELLSNSNKVEHLVFFLWIIAVFTLNDL